MEEFYLVNGKILDVRTGKFIKADLKLLVSKLHQFRKRRRLKQRRWTAVENI